MALLTILHEKKTLLSDGRKFGQINQNRPQQISIAEQICGRKSTKFCSRFALIICVVYRGTRTFNEATVL
jgi:hypothetical protein